jgi:hypothetical protein
LYEIGHEEMEEGRLLDEEKDVKKNEFRSCKKDGMKYLYLIINFILTKEA